MKWAQFINKYQKPILGAPIMKQFVLWSCFYVLSRHTNRMTDKGFNLFDECTTSCGHLFPQEEECKFTEDANWNKRKWRYSQNKDLSQKWHCQTLKASRIISSEIKISLLIVSWWCFSCLHIHGIGIQYTDLLFWKTIP